MQHDDEDDAQLLTSRSQVAERFTCFYRRHVDAVLAYYASRGLDAESAADLTAETFAAAYAARRRYRPRGPTARAWLLTIAARRQVDATRRWSREQRAIERLRIARPALDEHDASAYAELEAALHALPEDQRAAVQARIVEELPYDEVAQRSGTSEPAARQRVHRALVEMRTRLEDR